MGILDALLGPQNPVSSFVDSRPNTFAGLGAGLASGQNFSDGLAAGAQGLAAGKIPDAALQQQGQVANQTVQFLQAKYPDLAEAVLTRAISPQDAYTEAFKRAAVSQANAQAASKPVTLGQGQSLINPRTGASVASMPSAPVSVGQGASLVQPQTGNVVYSTPPKPVTLPSGSQLVNPDTGAPIGNSPAAQGATVMGIDPSTLPKVQLDANGNPTPDSQNAFLSALPPGTRTLVQQAISYQANPATLASIRGNQRQDLVTLASMADPTFDTSQFAARQRAKIAFTTGTQGQTITAANTAIQHLYNLATDAKSLPNNGLKIFNQVGNAMSSAQNSPALATYNTDAQEAGAELAKFFKGTGATDLTTTEEWKQLLDPSNGPDAINAVVNNIITKTIPARLGTMRDQYDQTMGKPSNMKFVDAPTAAVLTKMGIDPNTVDGLAPGSGAPVDMGDGVTIQEIQ